MVYLYAVSVVLVSPVLAVLVMWRGIGEAVYCLASAGLRG